MSCLSLTKHEISRIFIALRLHLKKVISWLHKSGIAVLAAVAADTAQNRKKSFAEGEEPTTMPGYLRIT